MRAVCAAAALSLAIGCSAPCPDGASEQFVRGESYCVAQLSGVIITGFCRGSHPYELDLEGGTVCSESPLDPTNVPSEVCAALGGRCGPLRRPIAAGAWTRLAELPAPRIFAARDAVFCNEAGLVVAGGLEAGDVRGAGVLLLRRSAEAWAASWDRVEPLPHFAGGALIAQGSVVLYGDDTDDPPSLVADTYYIDASMLRDVRTGAPSVRAETTPVFEGGRLVLFGGRDRYSPDALGDGASLDLTTGTWATLPTSSAPGPRSRHVVAGDGTGRVLVWGGASAQVLGSATVVGSALGDGAVLDVASGTWTMAAAAGPSPRVDAFAGHATVEGAALGWVVWGGVAASGLLLGDGGVLTPDGTTWLPIASEGAPSRSSQQRGAVGGRWLYVVGGLSAASDLPIVAYDLVTETWYALPGPTARTSMGVCATEQSLIVVGGADAANRYLADVWEWRP